MRRATSLLALPMVLLALTACDTVTDLNEVSMEGRWDGAGAIQEDRPGLSLFFSEGENGTFSGTWSQSQTGGQGSVVGGTYENGVVTFTLSNFPGGPVTFEGELTDYLRMEGSFSQVDLEGPAVFRRSSYSPNS